MIDILAITVYTWHNVPKNKFNKTILEAAWKDAEEVEGSLRTFEKHLETMNKFLETKLTTTFDSFTVFPTHIIVGDITITRKDFIKRNTNRKRLRLNK